MSGSKKSDMIDRPAHYTFGDIEVIDAIEAWRLDHHEGNAIKYIVRAEHKENRIEDLRKAVYYLKRKIWLLTGGEKEHGKFDANKF